MTALAASYLASEQAAIVGTLHKVRHGVRHPSEVWLLVALGTFAATGLAALKLQGSPDGIQSEPIDPVYVVGPQPLVGDAVAWFDGIRRFCNPVEVESRVCIEPPPATPEGTMHEAACYALAGRIDRARDAIERLPHDLRYRAAGVVFEAGHPAADAGDDVAAGPLMELVVEYWPNHYMALYHAGAARFELGDYAVAEPYLLRFMDAYSTEDGWRSSGRGMLQAIDERK